MIFIYIFLLDHNFLNLHWDFSDKIFFGHFELWDLAMFLSLIFTHSIMCKFYNSLKQCKFLVV